MQNIDVDKYGKLDSAIAFKRRWEPGWENLPTSIGRIHLPPNFRCLMSVDATSRIRRSETDAGGSNCPQDASC